MLPTFNIDYWLLPLSWLYEAGVRLRNWCFDRGFLHSTSFEGRVPVICVGNVSAGGTAKTPHVEYLVRLFQEEGIAPVAVLSRGYKRKSQGFQLATPESTAQQLGDEPYQIHRKFPDAIVAVCEKRVEGIRRLLDLPTPPAVVILDDAMQHRWIQPGFTICLTSYHRIMYKDYLLPAGRLREPAENVKRANAVIVTKCPSPLRGEERTEIEGNIPTDIEQPLYYTTFEYENLINLATLQPQNVDPKSNVLMVAGIADPTTMEQYIQTHFRLLDKMIFSDHHNFSVSDIREIKRRMETIVDDGLNPDTGLRSIVFTTEKDAMRLLRHPALDEDLRSRIFFQPARITFLKEEQQNKFNRQILSYVRKNQTNR